MKFLNAILLRRGNSEKLIGQRERTKVKGQQSKGGNMKNIRVIIIILLIGVAVVCVVYHQQQKPVVIKTKRELVKGREEVKNIKGKEEVRKEEKKEIKKKIKIKKNEEVEIKDSTLDLKIKVQNIDEDSVELFFDLAYFEKSFLRVDTIKIKQLDTLKIETEKIIVEEIPFYEKFWFGGILGGVLVLLIVIASGK